MQKNQSSRPATPTIKSQSKSDVVEPSKFEEIREVLRDPPPPEPQAQERELLKGWRLHSVTLCCLICVLLANMEVAIVSTSLVAIANDLGSFGRSSWIITSYLLTWTGFLIIWAKFSDHFGRRQSLCAALLTFVVASGACGGAQTTDQLIVFRAFQGIGGSGLLSISYVILPEMVEPKKYVIYASLTSLAVVLGYLFGPIFGGAIVNNTTWRWVFLLNLPVGIANTVFLVLVMPAGFPDIRSKHRTQLSKFQHIDFAGAVLIFATCAFLVSALEEAGTSYAWNSATIIVLLTLAGLCAVAFMAWEYFVDYRNTNCEAMLTWRLVKNRVFMGALLMIFLSGIPFTVAVIQIPQEWQTVEGTSGLVAGIRLLPFTVLFSFGTILAAVLTSRLRIPVVFVLWLGSFLQVIGLCIMSLIPLRTGAGKYGSDILLGLGLGLSIGVIISLAPQLIRGKDQSAAMGAVTQYRAFGNVIGFAIATNAFNDYSRSKLSAILNPKELDSLLASVTTTIEKLPPSVQNSVKTTFASAYDLQMKIMIGFAVAQVFAVGLMWERKLRRLV